MKNKDYLKQKAEGLVSLSEGETAVKTYHCITLNNGENEGYLTVTDRRVLLVEVSSRNRDCRKTELPLEAVGGIDYRYRQASNAGKLTAAAIFLIVCAALMVVSLVLTLPYAWLKYVMWGVAGVCLVLALVFGLLRSPSLYQIRIYSSYPMTDFMGFSSTAKMREEKLLIKPAADCQVMLKEFGALILDIRQFGAAVKEKYLSKVEQKELKVQRRTEAQRQAEAQAIEEERARRLEEKQRRQRLKEQRKLEKESRKVAKKKPASEEDGDKEQFFDILNK